jgi:protein-disulfide isomerase
MHELLFAEQGQVERVSGGALLQLMLDFGAKLPGLDQAAFAQSMNGRATLAAIKAADAEQRKRGITSQPIFEIGEQRLFGLQSFEGLQRAIEAALR